MSDDPVAESRKRKDPPLSPAPLGAGSTSDDDAEEPLIVRPDWRLPPEESHSDWTIEVCLGGKLYSKHHVHKVFLSRMSGYFKTLFQGSKSFSETQTSTSKIELQQEMASTAFPVMLDFMYSLWDDNNPPITHQNCTALNFLGEYFEIRALRQKARQFRNKNLAPDNFCLYYEHAVAFHDESTRNLLVKKCARDANAVLLESEDDIFQKTDAKFWMDVLEENKGVAQPKLSACIHIFCCHHEEALSPEIFRKLTDVSLLPEVCFASSCGLMKLEKSLVPGSAASTPSENSSEELTSLQQRCVRAIVSKWSDMYSDSMEEGLLEIGLHVYRKVMRDIVSLAKEQLESHVEDLNSLNHLLPRFVIVTCGGDHAFKGCYVLQDELRDGAPKWDRSNADARSETWEISFCEFEQNWYLSKLGDGDDPGTDERSYFYNEESQEESGLILPPRRGWKPIWSNAPELRYPGLELRYTNELPDAEE